MRVGSLLDPPLPTCSSGDRDSVGGEGGGRDEEVMQEESKFGDRKQVSQHRTMIQTCGKGVTTARYKQKNDLKGDKMRKRNKNVATVILWEKERGQELRNFNCVID